MAFEDYWNKSHLQFSNGKPDYDLWLEPYLPLFKNISTPVLDLGCGTGNDTLYLMEKGFNVISVDYSDSALSILKQYIPSATTQKLDISNPLPFKNDSFEVVVADLSLHYFDSETTKEILSEIKRILTKGGYFFARVNSIKDANYGALQGEKIEENFYYVNGYNKRFFTLDDAQSYFSIIGPTTVKEAMMLRYTKPKEVIEVVSKKED